jgi:O-antigen ligase
MTERGPKIILIGASILGVLVLAYAALRQPSYFTNQTYLGGLILLEFLIAAICFYRRVFFPIVIVAFLLAGVDLPVGTAWTAARWVFLGVGALVGCIITLKERGLRFTLFHSVACFSVLMALVSAAVSRYQNVALLKVLSLALLFLYAGTGARLAVFGRENRFFNGLVVGCEIFVAANAVLYAAGIEAMGNPNSLGAIMGVVCAPILLWGILLGGEKAIQRRRWVLYAITCSLAYASHARAGLAAVLLSSGLLCLALRRYKLAMQGSIVIVILLALGAIFEPEAITSLFTSVLYKNGDQQNKNGDQQTGLLASRESPWHAAADNIREHPWFGTGLGTTANGEDASQEQAKFSSTTNVTAEHGSSYLSVASGVGILGAVPFALLLALLLKYILATVKWMLKNRTAAHPAIPLAIVMFAGLAHAGFEDWMFAPGNYLCVFYWSLAFILADLAPSSHPSRLAVHWQPNSIGRSFGSVVPSR